MKTILVPVDFSSVTDALVEASALIGAAGEAKVFLVHVAPALSQELRAIQVPQHERDLTAHILREEHRDLQRLAERLTTRGYDVEALMVEGYGTIEKILEEAGRLDADLIVVGSHGHGRLYKMLLGSTCEGILRKARIPVLIVPADPVGAGEHAETEGGMSESRS